MTSLSEFCLLWCGVPSGGGSSTAERGQGLIHLKLEGPEVAASSDSSWELTKPLSLMPGPQVGWRGRQTYLGRSPWARPSVVHMAGLLCRGLELLPCGCLPLVWGPRALAENRLPQGFQRHHSRTEVPTGAIKQGLLKPQSQPHRQDRVPHHTCRD